MYRCYACGKEIEQPGESCPYCRFPVISTLHGGEEEEAQILAFAEEYRKTNPEYFAKITPVHPEEKKANTVPNKQPETPVNETQKAGNAAAKSGESIQKKQANLIYLQKEKERKEREEREAEARRVRAAEEAAKLASNKKKRVVSRLITLILLGCAVYFFVTVGLPWIKKKTAASASTTKTPVSTATTPAAAKTEEDTKDIETASLASEGQSEDTAEAVAEAASEDTLASDEDNGNSAEKGAKSVTSLFDKKKQASDRTKGGEETTNAPESAEEETTAEIKKEPDTVPFAEAQVGDLVAFGKYEQDNIISNGKETLAWRVLQKEGDQMLLISQYVLDCQLYEFSSEEYKNWSNCTIRSWLNEEFLKEAFTENEVQRIAVNAVNADCGTYQYTFNGKTYDNEPESPVEDRVFLLNHQAAEALFASDEDRMCEATAYAQAQGVGNRDGYCTWYLSSPYNIMIGYINSDGSIAYPHPGGAIFNDDAGLRPACWVRITP